MKGILIDAYNEKVVKVEFDGTLEDMYRLIKCDMVERVTNEETDDDIWLDEEGLLKDIENQKFFTIAGWDAPIAGNGLILGSTVHGDSSDAKMTLEWAKKNVAFYDIHEVRRLV